MRRTGTSVVVVDPQEIFRTGLGAILDSLPRIFFSGSASSAMDALKLVLSKQPLVALVDASFDQAEAGSFVRRIHEVSPGTAVVVLATDPRPSDVLSAVSAGAAGYMLKSAQRDDVAAAIERALAGETFVDPILAGRLVQALSEGAGTSARRPEPLTPREREVLGEISRGRSNKEIATDLSMASGTVKIHVERILRKLSAANRVEAATIGLHHGLIADEATAEVALGDSQRSY